MPRRTFGEIYREQYRIARNRGVGWTPAIVGAAVLFFAAFTPVGRPVEIVLIVLGLVGVTLAIILGVRSARRR